jgi:hypothetical protein
MKSYFTLALFLIVIFFTKALPQELPPESFFPSSVGNIWEYDTPDGITTFKIIKDSIDENKNRFIFYYNSQPDYKLDTLNNVYFVPYNLNWLKYKLDADSGDTWMVAYEDSSSGRNGIRAEVLDKYDDFIFGKPSILMQIGYWRLNWGDTVINDFATYTNSEILASNFGVIYNWSPEGGVNDKQLRGCVINKDTFGIITAIKENILDQSYYFKLSQNYPNPFNPSTTINYELAKEEFVTIKVYDILGREIAVLVNEEKRRGRYSIKFNADNIKGGLASGIYIYTFNAGKYFYSRKMILAK